MLHRLEQPRLQLRNTHAAATNLNAVNLHVACALRHHLEHKVVEDLEQVTLLLADGLHVLLRHVPIQVLRVRQIHNRVLRLLGARSRQVALDLLRCTVQLVHDHRSTIHLAVQCRLRLLQKQLRNGVVEISSAQHRVARRQHGESALHVTPLKHMHVRETDERQGRAVAAHVAEQNRVAVVWELVLARLEIPIIQCHRNRFRNKGDRPQLAHLQCHLDAANVRQRVVGGNGDHRELLLLANDIQLERVLVVGDGVVVEAPVEHILEDET